MRCGHGDPSLTEADSARSAEHRHDIDTYVGGRIRLRRTAIGMSQTRLGHAVDVTFQQVQKYERGTNRVGASRLYEMAVALDTPISFFFDGMPELCRPGQTSADVPTFRIQETLDMVHAFNGIVGAALRHQVFQLVEFMAGTENAATTGDGVALPIALKSYAVQ